MLGVLSRVDRKGCRLKKISSRLRDLSTSRGVDLLRGLGCYLYLYLFLCMCVYVRTGGGRVRLFCFGSLVILDVARCYLWLFTLYINIKISKNSC